MTFDYFYKQETEKYSFYMIPKVLMTDKAFRELSSDAKILYSILLDRASLSYKNGWIDSENRVYIYYPIDVLVTTITKSKPTIVKIFNELEEIGLIRRKRQGLGKPSMIYVMNFRGIVSNDTTLKKEAQNEIQEEKSKKTNSGCNEERVLELDYPKHETSEETPKLPEVKNFNFQKLKNLTSRSKESLLPEVKNFNSNYTENNNTENNYTEDSYFSFSADSTKSANEVKPKTEIKKFGTYENVFLSEDEYQELKRKITYLDDLIERMSLYLQSRKTNYRDYKAALLSWYLKDEKQKKEKINYQQGKWKKENDKFSERHYDQAFYERLMRGTKDQLNYD